VLKIKAHPRFYLLSLYLILHQRQLKTLAQNITNPYPALSEANDVPVFIAVDQFFTNLVCRMGPAPARENIKSSAHSSNQFTA
jgi:hypothetical protein